MTIFSIIRKVWHKNQLLTLCHLYTLTGFEQKLDVIFWGNVAAELKHCKWMISWCWQWGLFCGSETYCPQRKTKMHVFVFCFVFCFHFYCPNKLDANLLPPFYPLVGISWSAWWLDSDGWRLARRFSACRVFPYIILLTLSLFLYPDNLHLRCLASPPKYLWLMSRAGEGSGPGRRCGTTLTNPHSLVDMCSRKREEN